MTDATSDAEFYAEALKLLLQVAWANDQLDPKERELLVKLASAWRVAPLLDSLLDTLAQGKPLPQPNLAIVRTRPDKLLLAAQVLVAADGEVDEEENRLLAELRSLLGR
jgi:tellurite resistance protein